VEKKRLEIDDEAAERWTLLAREMLPFKDSNPREMPRDMGPGLTPTRAVQTRGEEPGRLI
jgi:hypothetical protein